MKLVTLDRLALLAACTAFGIACGDDPTGSGKDGLDATTPTDGTAQADGDATTPTPDGDATTTTTPPTDATVEDGDATTNPPDGDTAEPPDGDATTNPPDGDTVEPPPSCEDPIPAAPVGQTCGVVAGSDSALLIRADLIMPEGIQEQGQLLIVNGLIACAGCDCAEKVEAQGATVFNCPDAVVSPGLINAHDHITYDQGKPIGHGTTRYDHRNEWRNGNNGKPEINYDSNSDHGKADGDAWGELRQAMAGTTSMFGSGGAPGLVRNLDLTSRMEGIQHGAADYETFPLGSSGIYNSGCGQYDLPAATVANGKVAYVPHVSEGVSVGARNEFICLDGAQDGGVDIVADNVSFIHAIGTTAADIGIFVGEGAKLVWSPRSNTDLYGFTAYAPLYHKLGGQVALGTDWTYSGSMNILRELACASDWNARWDHYFSDQQLVNMATTWAASALGFGDVLGSLTVGKIADFVIWDAREHAGYRAILDAGSDDVVLVARGGAPPSIAGTTYYKRGRPIFGDKALVEELSDRQLNYASYDPAVYSATDPNKKKLPAPCEDVTVCGSTKSFCVAEQIESKPSGSSFFQTKTMTELKAALDQQSPGYTYDLFFCGTPDNEPSCVPFRPNEFNGAQTGADPDGDGLQGVDDNCPDYFNAIRPMDAGKQPDSDGDGVGDVCDVCPFDANTSACTSVNPDDIDGDGFLNDSDNCPSIPNPPPQGQSQQADRDTDGIGDECDACPDDSNAGGAACPSTILEVKNGTVEKGSQVALPGVVCVAAGSDFFTVQTKDAASPSYAGLYVYTGAAGTKCTPGDLIDLQGTIEDFHGQTEMTSPSFVKTPNATAPGVPAPFIIVPADVGPSGTKALEYEAVLVTVQNVSVTDITPTPATGETVQGEFVVNNALSVDDQLFLVTPFPTEGFAYPGITGVTRYTWNRLKLLPRNAADYQSGPPEVAAIEPAEGAMYADDVGGPFVVRLTGNAQGATSVTVTSDDTDVATVTNVTVPNGQSTAVIVVTAKTAGTVTLSAKVTTGGTVTKEATLTVVPAGTVPQVLSVEAQDTVTIGEDFDVTVTLDLPAPAGGQVVDLDVSPDAQATGPLSITISAGAYTGTATFTAGDTAGDAIITASIDASDASATVHVSDAPPAAEVIFCFEDAAGFVTTPTVDTNTSVTSAFAAGSGLQLVQNSPSAAGGAAARPAACTGANNQAANRQNWTTQTSKDATDYFEFAIDHGAGNYTITFELRKSNTGPSKIDVNSSLAGDLAAGTTLTADTSFHAITWTGALPGGHDLIRIYAYGSGGDGGTLRVDNFHLAPAP